MPVSPDTGNRFATPVADLLARHELDLLETAALALRGDQDRADWEATSLARIRLWRAQAERGVAGALAELGVAVRAALLGAQREGAAAALVDLPGEPAAQPQGMRGVLLSERRLGAQLAAALQSAPRLLEATLREAVRAGVDEVRTGKATRRNASQQVLDKLVAQGITGFRDKAGRNWSLSSYTEMAVRTETQARALAGGDESIRALGLDLVMVSDSPRECPLCRPFEGKVLSLTGDTPSRVPVGVDPSEVELPTSGSGATSKAGMKYVANPSPGAEAVRSRLNALLRRGGPIPRTGKSAVLKPGTTRTYQSHISADKLRPYTAAGAERPVGFLDEDGTPVLYDGHHRTVAAWAAGHSQEMDLVDVGALFTPDKLEDLDPDERQQVQALAQKNQPGTTRRDELTGEMVKVDVYMTLADARAKGYQHPNCTHSHSAYIPGITKLDKPKANPDGYEAKQRQRALERQVRSAKRAEALALDPTAKAQARARVRDRQAQLRQHVKDEGLKRQPGRESVTKAV